MASVLKVRPLSSFSTSPLFLSSLSTMPAELRLHSPDLPPQRSSPVSDDAETQPSPFNMRPHSKRLDVGSNHVIRSDSYSQRLETIWNLRQPPESETQCLMDAVGKALNDGQTCPDSDLINPIGFAIYHVRLYRDGLTCSLMQRGP